MSIYSGFPTRLLESAYNQCVCELLSTMQQFILDFLKLNSNFPFQSFSEDFNKSLIRLTKFEKQKHLQPNFSSYLQDLESFLKNSGVKLLPKSKEQVSPVQSKNGMIEKRSDVFRKTVKKFENPGSAGRFCTTRESPRFFRQEKRIKVYQDKILRSIIKDLALEC